MRIASTPLSRIVATLWSRHGLSIVLIGSLCLNMAQAQRLRALARPAAGGALPGTVVGPLRVTAHDGTSLELFDPASGQPTILYYFSPSCRWCERNWPNVTALERESRGRYRFIAVSSTDGAERIIAEHNLDFGLYTGLTISHSRALGFDATPHTVIVSPSGRVVRAWVGAFNGAIRSEIESYFRIVLPGLTPRSDSAIP